MTKVKNTKVSIAKINRKAESQEKSKKWNNKPPFLKSKTKVSMAQGGNRNRETLPEIPLKKFKVDALDRARIEDGIIKVRPIKKQPA